METPVIPREFYTEKTTRIKWLPKRVSKLWHRTGLLLPPNYPEKRLAVRKQLTASMWNAYSACQRNFALRYIAGLQRKGGYLPLHVGTFSHNLFTSLLLGDEIDILQACHDWRTYMEEGRAKLLSEGISVPWTTIKLYDQANIVATMAVEWRARWADTVTPLAVSVRGRVPLCSPSGRRHPVWDYGWEFDGIVRDLEFGDLWVWEFKTTAMSDQAAYESYIEHDAQAWGYTWAASKVFGRPVGMVYDVCRKKTAKGPRLICCKKAACRTIREAVYPGAATTHFMLGNGSAWNSLEDLKNIAIGKDFCDQCGGTGFIGISTRTFTIHLPSLEVAMRVLLGQTGHARISPAGAEQVSSDDFSDFVSRVKYEWSNLQFRIWRRPTPEYLDAFETEIYQVAREVGRKTARSSGPDDHKQWLRMRGSCTDFTGKSCSFTPICPSINGSGYDLFETRDASVPVELADTKESHDTGIISF